MNEIRSLLRIAARRLHFTAFIAAAHATAVAAAVIALALALADRAGAAAFVPWAWIGPALALAALAVAGVLWSRRRLSELQVALCVDERLELRERLSTALHCRDRDDAFAQAAVQDAVATARDPRSGEALRRRFRVTAPRRWWVSPLMVLATAGVLLAPPMNLFARGNAPDPALLEQAQLEVDDTIEVIAQTMEDKPQLRAELADLVDELSEQSAEPDALQRPEEIKRDALKKVTELNKRLDDILSGEKGRTAKAIEKMLSSVQAPEDGPAKELADALAEGDFAKAKEALKKLADQAEKGALDEKQKEQLAQQLEALGQQLQQLAQQQQALEDALRQAGLDPRLADNPQALQQALQQAQNLNDQQKQQLQQMVQAQQQAQQMCQGLGGACQQMAQGLAGGKPGQGGQQMAGQLDQLEQLQQLLQQAQAAANQCQGQGLGQGLGQGMSLNQMIQQWQQGQGGMGQWGHGAGGVAQLSRTPTGTKMVKEDVAVGDGEIIASSLVDGTPISGESKAKLRQVIHSRAEGYDEAQNEDPIPRRYEEAQKHYFGELQKQVEGVRVAPKKKEEPKPEAARDPDPDPEPEAETGK